MEKGFLVQLSKTFITQWLMSFTVCICFWFVWGLAAPSNFFFWFKESFDSVIHSLKDTRTLLTILMKGCLPHFPIDCDRSPSAKAGPLLLWPFPTQEIAQCRRGQMLFAVKQKAQCRRLYQSNALKKNNMKTNSSRSKLGPINQWRTVFAAEGHFQVHAPALFFYWFTLQMERNNIGVHQIRPFLPRRYRPVTYGFITD